MEKIAERLRLIKTTGKHCGKTLSIYLPQKTINGDPKCCPWAICSGFFMYLNHLCHLYVFGTMHAMLLTLRFYLSKRFECSCEKLLKFVTWWQRLSPPLERRRYLRRTSTVTSRIARHFNYNVMLAQISMICFGAF